MLDEYYDTDDENTTGEPKIAGTYRVEDSIHNLKVRIKVTQQKPKIAELFEDSRETLDPDFIKEEELVIGWQEKIFSSFEVKFFRELKHCLTDVQREYRRKILEENIKGSRIYTQTNQDSYYPDNYLLTRPFISTLALRNERALPQLRNRKPFSRRYNKKIIDEKPTDQRICSNHYFYDERETMYILADLSPINEDADNSKDSVNLICTITYDKIHKILTVDPDFSNQGSYKVVGTGMVYDYWISHIPKVLTKEEEEHYTDSLKEEIYKLKIFKESKLDPNLEMAPRNVLRLHLNLEIISAHNYSFDYLFITYFLHLPKNWTTPDKDSLNGRTQRCQMRNKKANFSYVVETCLDLNLKSLRKKNVMLHWPHLLIIVASLDSWERLRAEGYGSMFLPMKSGIHYHKIQTWRPSGGFAESLRWFFTGGVTEKENYFDVPEIHNENKLIRNHLKVIPSGYVTVKINSVQQSRKFKDDFDYLEKMNSDSLINNVEDVLVQFQKAKERMIRAKTFS